MCLTPALTGKRQIGVTGTSPKTGPARQNRSVEDRVTEALAMEY